MKPFSQMMIASTLVLGLSTLGSPALASEKLNECPNLKTSPCRVYICEGSGKTAHVDIFYTEKKGSSGLLTTRLFQQKGKEKPAIEEVSKPDGFLHILPFAWASTKQILKAQEFCEIVPKEPNSNPMKKDTLPTSGKEFSI